MTSSNGNLFRVTGHLCGEFSFDVCFDLRLNKRLSKQSWGWWFETQSCSLWRHFNVWGMPDMAGPHITDRNICRHSAWLQLYYIYMLCIFLVFVVICCPRLPPIALEKLMLIIFVFVRLIHIFMFFSCLNQDDTDSELNDCLVVIVWMFCLNAASSPIDEKRLLNIMVTDLPKGNTMKYYLSLFRIRLW